MWLGSLLGRLRGRRIGVRELLLIDRDPWALELYRL